MMDLLPNSEDEFSEVAYWDRFHSEKGQFEWYIPAREFAKLVEKHAMGPILNLGCGTCRWPLFSSAEVLSVDNSEVAVRWCQERSLECRVDDALELGTVADASFQLVVDKGLVDALHPRANDQTLASLTKLMRTAHRVLIKDGKLLVVSLLQSHIRDLLEQASSNCWQACHLQPVDDSDSEHLPFVAVFSKKGNQERLFFRETPCETWRDLWSRVDDEIDLRRTSRRKRVLTAVTFKVGLRGSAGLDPLKVASLRDAVLSKTMSNLNKSGWIVQWQAPPSVRPLAFGLSDVTATVLLDPRFGGDGNDFCAHLGALLGSSDDDDDDSDDSDEEEEDDAVVRIAPVEVLESTTLRHRPIM